MRQHLCLNRHSSICAQEPSSSRSSLTKVNWSTPYLVYVIRHSQLIPIIVIRPEKMISLPTQPIAGAAATMICENPERQSRSGPAACTGAHWRHPLRGIISHGIGRSWIKVQSVPN